MQKRLMMFLMAALMIFSSGPVWGYYEGAVNFFGVNAGANNTGSYNNFFGASAGNANTTGEYNSFFGSGAGKVNETASYNSFFGAGSGIGNTTGIANSFFGHAAGYTNTEGSQNSFFGQRAGFSNTTGHQNGFFGKDAGYSNTTGYENTFFGSNAGYNNTEGAGNSFFGSNAGYYNTTGEANSFFGPYAGAANTTGYENSFFGAGAGYLNTTGFWNTFIGMNAGNNNTVGNHNVFIGFEAGVNNTTGSDNVFLGFNAGRNEIGSNKLYISNYYWGDIPLIYGEFDNQYLEVNGTLNVQGVDAYNEFQLKVSGHSGGNSHAQLVTDDPDSRFTFMAAEASDQAPRFQLVGPQDVSTGARGWVLADFGSLNYNLPNAQFNIRHYNTSGPVYMMQVFGRQKITFPTGNVGIGTTSPTHLIHLAGGAYSNGSTWVNASSRELKENITEVSAEEAIKTVANLKPVAFNYKKGDQDLHLGFIAEDVPELVATADRKGLESMDIVAVLTKVVQEQQRTMQEQQNIIQELQKAVEEQQAMIGELRTALQFKLNKDANVAQAN